MQTVSEFNSDRLVYNHIIHDKDFERHLAKHSHSLVEMIYIIKGEVVYTIEDKKFTAHQGELIVIKPLAYHYFTIKNQQDYEKIAILFPSKEIDVESVMDKPFMLLQCNNGRIHDIFSKIDFYYHNCEEGIFQELLFSLAKEIVVNIKFFSKQYLVASPADPVHPMIERAISYINENLFKINTVKELAEYLSVSESHLKVLFANQLKVTPKNYITEKKMLLAKSMLSNGSPPTQVAFHCGYSNYVTFYRLYSKFFKTNPLTDYKNSR